MEIQNSTFIGIVGTVVAAILSFLIGKSGVVRRYFDNRLSKVERQQKKEEDEVEKTQKENIALHNLVDELTSKVSHLEKELALTNFKLQTLLAYFEKTIPDPDSFIEKLKQQVG